MSDKEQKTDNYIEKDIETTRKVLEQCGLAEPVPEEYQKILRKKRRKELVKLLKKAGDYGFFEGAVLYVFFAFAKMGLRLSVFQSAVVLGVASVAVAAGVSSGGYTAIDHFVLSKSAPEKTVEETKIVKKETPVPKKIKYISPVYLSIDGTNIDKKVLSSIEQKIKKYFLRNRMRISKKYLISGEVNCLDEKYFVKIEAFNSKTLEKVYLKRVEVRSEKELYPFFLKTLKEIYQKVKG
ncbi:MAG: hypothetical protein GY754_27235 [bacterium]|nr:hypothetical protein [bacterium]